MTQNLPGKRVKPGYTIERQPKPTAVRILLVLAGLAVTPLTVWWFTAAMPGGVRGTFPWSVWTIYGSLFVAYWLITKANEPDLIEKSNDASYPNGEIVDETTKDHA
jgi:hypothetical protein